MGLLRVCVKAFIYLKMFMNLFFQAKFSYKFINPLSDIVEYTPHDDDDL